MINKKVVEIAAYGAGLALLVAGLSEQYRASAKDVDSFDSYLDKKCEVVSNEFMQMDAIIYMMATGVKPEDNYAMLYYDAEGNVLQIEQVISNAQGRVYGMIQPSSFNRPKISPPAAGTWKALLYKSHETKMEKDGKTSGKPMATDTFEVKASAIPEIETVASGLGLITILAVTYFGLKNKMLKKNT